MRYRSTALAIALLGMLNGVASPVRAVEATPCSLADQLLEARQLDLAMDEYARVAKEVGDPCADIGMAAVSSRKGAAAAALSKAIGLQAAGRLEEAKSSLTEALGADPKLGEASESLAKLLEGESAPRLYAAAELLSAAGIDPAAKAALEAAIKENAKNEAPASIPPDLLYLVDRPAWEGRDWERRLGPWIGELVRFATYFLAVGVVLWLFLRLWGRRTRRLNVDAFDDGPVTQKDGKLVSTMIANEVDRLRTEGAGGTLRFVRGPDPEIKIPAELGSGSAPAKIVGDLLGYVPTKTLTLTGTLLPKADTGVGLALNLAGWDKTIRAATVLWDQDFIPPAGKAKPEDSESAGYRRLAIVAATWAVYEMPLADRERMRVRLMTDRWLSQAKFRIGAAWQEARKDTLAVAAYRAALREDATNSGALFNLAMLEAADNATSAAGRWRDGIARLEQALARTKEADRKAEIETCGDRLWYRIEYNLGAFRFHEVLESSKAVRRIWNGNAWQPPLDEADGALLASSRSDAITVLGAALRRLRDDDRAIRIDRLQPEMREFLETVELASAMLLADILAHEARPVGEGATALTRSAMANDVSAMPGGAEGPSAPDLVAYVTKNLPRGVRAAAPQYNLACYYSGLAQREAALAAFRAAIALQDVRKWAGVDPSLEWLRKQPGFREALQSGPWTDDRPVNSELAAIPSVGSGYAAALAELDIDTVAALIERLKHHRGDLEKKLNIEPDLLKRWSSQLAMLELTSLGPADLRLLVAAGIESIGELKRRNPDQLRAMLVDVNRIDDAVSRVPSTAEVAKWIVAARAPTP